MQKLFWFGLVCVVLGLLSVLVPITRNQPETFQTGGIGISSPVPQVDHRPMPGAVGAILIIGGFSMMVGGCRKYEK